ncbi:MAG: GNAT family N-acetyltransferase [Hyphomicrobiaceae bacterium]|jgi:GNAT superfamily N-acetyltransferase
MTVRVRRLEAKDKAAWLPLFKAYIEFYKATVPDDVIEVTWARLLSGVEGVHIGYVAVDDSDKPIGIAHVLFHRSTWSPTWYCYLEDLFVEPTLRAKGVGRKLIEAVYQEAEARQCTRTYWTTQEFNYRARGLYDQMATKSPFVQYRR